jgi:hypothetical protein
MWHKLPHTRRNPFVWVVASAGRTGNNPDPGASTPVRHCVVTTSQPQRDACEQNSTAPVGPSCFLAPPGGWHHPTSWLGHPIHPQSPRSVSAPNTRSPVFVHRGVGPGMRPVLGQVSAKRVGGQGGLGSSRFLAGFRSEVPAGGARGGPRLRARGRQIVTPGPGAAPGPLCGASCSSCRCGSRFSQPAVDILVNRLDTALHITVLHHGLYVGAIPIWGGAGTTRRSGVIARPDVH